MKTVSRNPSEALLRYRNLMGITQNEMASEFWVAPGTIALWEGNRRQMPGPARKLLSLKLDQLRRQYVDYISPTRRYRQNEERLDGRIASKIRNDRDLQIWLNHFGFENSLKNI